MIKKLPTKTDGKTTQKGTIAEMKLAEYYMTHGYSVEMPMSTKKNSADLIIDGDEYQVKWLQDTNNCDSYVLDCGENGNYKYINKNGKPMALIVPRDFADKIHEKLYKTKEINTDNIDLIIVPAPFDFEQI